MAEGTSFGKTAPLKHGNRFENPWSTYQGLPGFWGMLKWQTTKKHRNTKEDIEKHLPVEKPVFHPSPPSGLVVTWLGHASVLVQIDGVTVLTDPIFSHRCSPVGFYGPVRYRPPPCTVDELPKINAVVISHNHYDHLDVDAVHQLHARFGNDLRWHVPLGLAGWFRKCGVVNVIELNWWESSRVGASSKDETKERDEVELVCLPCQHWSLRSGFDKNLALWSSWAVLGKKHRFYFGGDTGYCPEFKNIGAHYGPFDISAIPIGCYEPRYFMCQQHVSPGDAVKIHQDVRSKYSIGIHWGTYDMGSTEAPLAPKATLAEEVQKAGLDANAFFTIHHGQSWQLPEEA